MYQQCVPKKFINKHLKKVLSFRFVINIPNWILIIKMRQKHVLFFFVCFSSYKNVSDV